MHIVAMSEENKSEERGKPALKKKRTGSVSEEIAPAEI